MNYEAAENNTELSHITGNYGLPFIGKTFSLLSDPAGTYREHHLQHGNTSKMCVTGIRTLLLVGPDHARDLLLDPDKNYSTKMGWSGFMGDFFRGGVLMRDFDEHRIHRRIMQTAFKNSVIRGYVPQINAIVAQSVKEWEHKPSVLMFDEIKILLLKIAFQVFCYTDPDSPKVAEINRHFIDMLEGSMGIIRKDWPGLLYRRGMNGRRALFAFFKSLVPEKRKGHDQDIMSHFCRETKEDGELFSDDEIAEHMIFLMLAAHDTTASTLTMAIYYLAAYPQWQETLRKEITALPHGEPDYDNIFGGMPQSTLVFNETLRLHPPVSTTYRRTVRDCIIDGVKVPAHTMLTCPIIYNHRLAQYWSDPELFKPERFDEQHAEHKQHPFLWIPFGGGAHKCIGIHFAELLFKSTVAGLLKEHRIEFAKANYFPAKLVYFPFTKPADNLELRLLRK